MKTQYYFSLLIATSLLTYSCKEESEAPVSSTPKEIIMPRVQTLPIASPPNGTTAPTQTVQNVTPLPMPVIPQPVKVAKGTNPAHGQPGHRCDIAVGAPLNSPVKSNMATNAPNTPSAPYTITQTPSSPTPAATSATTPALLNPNATTTAPGMNPPHGQEGHRCDVAVGSPLPK